MRIGSQIGHAALPHQVGDHETGAAGDSFGAVHEHIPALAKPLLEPVAAGVEVLLDAFFFVVGHVESDVFDALKPALRLLALERRLQIIATNTNGPDFILLDGLLVIGSILVA